jgi:predicted HTH domain antitoxin
MIKLTRSKVVDEGIDSLIHSGYFKNKEKLMDEAFRTLLEVKPEIRVEIAVELYKEEKVSFGKASEIAGISQEGFKKILKSRGIKRIIEGPDKDTLDKEVEEFLE